MTRKCGPLAMSNHTLGFGIRSVGRERARECEATELTLLVCNGTHLLDLAVQRGHKLGNRRKYKQSRRLRSPWRKCRLLLRLTDEDVRIAVLWRNEVFQGQRLLTAQAGSSVRLEALVRGAAKRARVAMEYFILRI